MVSNRICEFFMKVNYSWGYNYAVEENYCKKGCRYNVAVPSRDLVLAYPV